MNTMNLTPQHSVSMVFSQQSAQQRQQADAFVASMPAASPYYLSGWRSAIEQVYGHQAGCLLAINRIAGQDDTVIGLLPYVHFKHPFSATRLISQPFCDFSGPLAINNIVEQALVQQLALMQPLTMEIRYGNGSDGVLQNSHKVRMVTPLPENADTLLASYKPKLRSQIKKAGNNGLSAEVRFDQQAVALFYRVYSINMKRLGSPPHSLAWFQAILQHYPAGQAMIGLVWYQQQVVAAGIVLRSGQQAVIPWASSLVDFNHLAPNMLLYWCLQAHLADNGVRFFDMGRSTPEEGTYRFKKQWGAEAIPLDWQLLQPHQQQVSHLLSTQEAKSSTLRSCAEKVWQQLPLPVANLLGAKIRRFISL